MTTVETAGRLLISLAVVLGIIWVIARRARKGIHRRGTRSIEVLDRASLSRGSSIALVRVNDRAYVLGVAEAQVSLLGETDLASVTEARETVAPALTARPTPTPSGRVSRPSHRRVRSLPSGPGRSARSSASTSVELLSPRPTAGEKHGSTAGIMNAAKEPHRPLTGSALSPQTWKQTLEALRDMTARP